MNSRTIACGATLAWGSAPDRGLRRSVSRGLLRLLLPPGAVLAQVCGACGGDHGPVRVRVDGESGPLVSVSYAGPLAVVGLAPRGASAFGIDAEADDAATRLSVREAAGAEEVACWTRREAVAKATGTGLRGRPAPITAHPALPGRWISPRPGLHGFDEEIAHDGVRYVLSVALG